MSATGIWAVLPVKNIENAKQRLSPTLAPEERRALFQAMVEDVLSALAAGPGLAGIMMVTRDPEAIRLGERYGARVLIEEANLGHSEASTLAAQTLAAQGVAGMLQIPGDLPAVTADDVAAVLDAHGEAPAMTIAPSRDDRGSNALACSPPDLLPFRFGEDSFHPHCARARELGVEPTVVRRPGLGLDIDTPDDLKAFLAAPSDGRAHRYLLASGIAQRLLRPTSALE
ncbi:MAG: 2-phospho-L-lactate guanylyltransferase [Alphaproteobacteria bacterium]|nr:2-phospho-L-lactate guanylyltransferase [Alphaproteobacteria bacterium]